MSVGGESPRNSQFSAFAAYLLHVGGMAPGSLESLLRPGKMQSMKSQVHGNLNQRLTQNR